jgi:uncharacterized membrane protein YqaE (UPF0057 family)
MRAWVLAILKNIREGEEQEVRMSCLRVVLCIIFPPLAVIDQGCGSIVIVTLLTLAGWVPGVLAAIFIVSGRGR